MKKHTKKWSRKKLLKFSLITLLVFFLLLELIGRIIFYIKFNNLHTSVYVQGSPLLIADTVTVYNNRPFYVDYEKRFQYNEVGMKTAPGKSRMPVKQADELWVLLLGASAMEGMGSNRNGNWFDITNVSDHPHHQTIAAFLEKDLQLKFPGKKIHVFNGGVSAYTLSQSMKRYEVLSRQYKFDWVISMDGVNEPAVLQEQQHIESYNERQWMEQPFHHNPLKLIIPVTQHSAFFNFMKQELFYMKQNVRINANKANGFPERLSWLKQTSEMGEDSSASPEMNRIAAIYIDRLGAFQERLKADKKNYLLLVQPHLAFRNQGRLSIEEKALMNYYRKEHNDIRKYAFLKTVYHIVNSGKENSHIQTMSGIDSWERWTFVDYCHFTTGANKRIASELANFIQSDGRLHIFQ